TAGRDSTTILETREGGPDRGSDDPPPAAPLVTLIRRGPGPAAAAAVRPPPAARSAPRTWVISAKYASVSRTASVRGRGRSTSTTLVIRAGRALMTTKPVAR